MNILCHWMYVQVSSAYLLNININITKNVNYLIFPPYFISKC